MSARTVCKQMAILDRRSGRERRKNERYGVTIDVEWESQTNGRTKGPLSDISAEGCFILAAGDVSDGETVKIFLPLAGGMKAQFIAVIVNHVYEIGFAVRFVELTAAQKDFLEKFVNALKK